MKKDEEVMISDNKDDFSKVQDRGDRSYVFMASIKVFILCLALVLVISASKFFSSGGTIKSVADLIAALEGNKAISWCPDHAVDFVWLDPAISQKWKNASWPSIQKRVCKVSVDPTPNIDLTKLQFQPLLRVHSAEAKVALLEWNPENRVFQANGMPFFSSNLSSELLDK